MIASLMVTRKKESAAQLYKAQEQADATHLQIGMVSLSSVIDHLHGKPKECNYL